ncbi:D-alanyl-D-alanine carboxypeptidase family protein [Alkalicoccus chagannorensis]|uniref:D-alanyl-D-alanine carboxypeptidase family protein n=1 Tax=Alkalicoccus chagannorensis TaxID=427072 RepID=UPI0003FD9E5B|nr:D-alanyl-D-alanine carboxypeptidase family protein [Alkalicoccus chagannorensis]
MMIKKTAAAAAGAAAAGTIFAYTQTAEATFQPSVDTIMLVDAETGQVLLEENAQQPLPPASMTKMMSEYLILEAINDGDMSWDDEVSISDFHAELSHDQALSNVMLRTDETYSVEELYESVAIYSANAATMALAEHMSGSEGAFVETMNERGEEIGMGETLREAGEAMGSDSLEETAAAGEGDFQFVNTTGLPNHLLNGSHPDGTGEEEDNYMTAEAAAVLGFHLVNDYPEVLEAASIPEMTFREGTDDAIDMMNWNWMIEGTQSPDLDYEYIDGLKTGHTEAAGFTFTGTAERDGQRFISVVMGADSESHRFQETESVMEWGFDNFSEEEIFAAGLTPEEQEEIDVVNGEAESVGIESTDSVSHFVMEDEEEAFSYDVQLDEEMLTDDGALDAPVEAGTVIGQMQVSFDGERDVRYLNDDMGRDLTVDLVTTEDVERSGWFTLTMNNVGSFFSGLWSGVTSTVRGWF